jgi:hypothetical protein
MIVLAAPRPNTVARLGSDQPRTVRVRPAASTDVGPGSGERASRSNTAASCEPAASGPSRTILIHNTSSLMARHR